MKTIDQIIKYIPFNEQEENDKKLILMAESKFDNLLKRDNEIIHYTSSAWILNKDHDKVLMIYHNIYDSWAWAGGHSDGCADFLKTAIIEVEEETGLQNIKLLLDGIFTIDVLTVNGHIKKGKYVSSHLHISTCFLFEADDKDILRIKEDENSGVKWFDINNFLDYVSENHMKPVYQKIIDKAKKLEIISE